MSILLPLDHYIRWHAFVAHGFGIGLMVPAAPVDLVSHLRRRQAVVTLYFGWMHSFALQLALLQPIIERNMSCIRDKLVVQAVNTLRVRAMLAQHLSCLMLVLGIDCSAVQAATTWTVVTLRFIVLRCSPAILGRLLLLVNTHAVEALSPGRMVALGRDGAVPAFAMNYSRSLALMPVCATYFLGFLD